MDAKAGGEHGRSELPGLDVTISVPYYWSVARQLISFPLRHWNLRNLTLQTLELFSAYARLYNAAASPASRLRSSVSLAINIPSLSFLKKMLDNNYSVKHLMSK